MLLREYQISTYVFFLKLEKIIQFRMQIEGQKEEEYSEGLEKVVQRSLLLQIGRKFTEATKTFTKDKIIFVKQNIDYLTGNKIHLTLILYCTTFRSLGKCCSEFSFLSRGRSVEWKALINYFKVNNPYSSIHLVPYRRS